MKDLASRHSSSAVSKCVLLFQLFPQAAARIPVCEAPQAMESKKDRESRARERETDFGSSAAPLLGSLFHLLASGGETEG